MTIKTLQQHLSAQLRALPFVEEPQLEARLLITHICGMTIQEYFLCDDRVSVDQANLCRLDDALAKRRAGKSIAAIIGKQEFYDRTFIVDDTVLIPRPDTEVLVEYALGLISHYSLHALIDIGTGPGTIALTVAAHAPQVMIDALDISEAALALFTKNRILNGVSEKQVKALRGDINTFKPAKKYDLILSNPPYIRSADVIGIRERHDADDPVLALDGGESGLDFYYAIREFAAGALLADGFIVLEHGFDQAEALRTLFSGAYFMFVETLRDLGGHERVTVFKKVSC